MTKYIFLLLVIMPYLAICQTNTQTVRGTISDKQSQTPLPGVVISIPELGNKYATISDENGEFRIAQVPVGRRTLQFFLIGYHSATVSNLLVYSGKESVLKLELEEKVVTTQEAIVTAGNKGQPINEMALISARSFTVEQTERYAGTWYDPARMAANYAGVAAMGDQRNDIIIRGNSPVGLLWRLEGVNIPNPNHFGSLGTTGGPISILNNNLLDNSDFFTGAFPAEYGNALAGVFDLRMRSGNNEKREYTGQIGLNGLELGAEGPISKSGKSSYLINYRYSTLELFKKLGINYGVSAAPQYQDLSFKFNFPRTKFGKISLFGIGGTSFIEVLKSKQKSTDWTFGLNNIDVRYGSDMGVAGLTHVYFFNPNENNSARLNTSFAISGEQSTVRSDSAYIDKPSMTYYHDRSYEIKYTASSQLSKKYSSRFNTSLGVSSQFFKVYYSDSALNKNYEFVKLNQTNGENIALIQAFAQAQYSLTPVIKLYGGLHSQYFTLNGSKTLEPRVALRWNISGSQSLNLGAGIHSQLQPRLFYFVQTRLPDHSYIETNTQLDFSYSDQVILAYDWNISENFRLKTETYYQNLRNIPVEQKLSHYSILNFGSDFGQIQTDSLVNNGTGYNYGLELTLEKLLADNYYILFTSSLFQSKYKGSDGILRNTIFNGNYVLNLLSGYTFALGANHSLSIDIKAVTAGGKRYIPILEAESKIKGDAVRDYHHAYENRYPSYFRFDARAMLRFNLKKFNTELSFDVQNITKRKNVLLETYNAATSSIQYDYQLGLFWVALWRIQF